jgi:broad specificity phosphatase PhoE
MFRRTFAYFVIVNAIALSIALTPVIAATNVATASASKTIILVRHAERAEEKSNDPGLSEKGVARAVALAMALKDAGITAILTTQLQRTRQTALPIAMQVGVVADVMPIAKDGMKAHLEAIVARVQSHQRGAILIVGHSNTIPNIIAALGGPALPIICEGHFSHLFVMNVDGEGKVALVRSRYGAADNPDTSAKVDSCL